MAKDNSILIIGGLAVAAFFLLNKRGSSSGSNAYVPYRPTNGGYGGQYQTGGSSTGQIIQGAGSAIADIINAIKNKGSNSGSNNQSGGIDDLDEFSNDDYWDYINSDYFYA